MGAFASRPLDVVFVHPDSSAQAYQGLATTYSAIEPPTWALLLAQSCRTKGFGCAILDCDAEKLSLDDAVARLESLAPRLVVFVVYGQNPNSGTTSMIGATRLAARLRERAPQRPIAFVGSHVSALPKQVLALPHVDFVLIGEGVYALHDLLRGDLGADARKVPGVGWETMSSQGGGEADMEEEEEEFSCPPPPPPPPPLPLPLPPPLPPLPSRLLASFRNMLM